MTSFWAHMHMFWYDQVTLHRLNSLVYLCTVYCVITNLEVSRTFFYWLSDFFMALLLFCWRPYHGSTMLNMPLDTQHAMSMAADQDDGIHVYVARGLQGLRFSNFTRPEPKAYLEGENSSLYRKEYWEYFDQRGMKSKKDGENCIMWRFIICSPHQITY
jgi:hypothetical protein